jgi:hypothetical protein
LFEKSTQVRLACFFYGSAAYAPHVPAPGEATLYAIAYPCEQLTLHRRALTFPETVNVKL